MRPAARGSIVRIFKRPRFARSRGPGVEVEEEEEEEDRPTSTSLIATLSRRAPGDRYFSRSLAAMPSDPPCQFFLPPRARARARENARASPASYLLCPETCKFMHRGVERGDGGGGEKKTGAETRSSYRLANFGARFSRGMPARGFH